MEKIISELQKNPQIIEKDNDIVTNEVTFSAGLEFFPEELLSEIDSTLSSSEIMNVMLKQADDKEAYAKRQSRARDYDSVYQFKSSDF